MNLLIPLGLLGLIGLIILIFIYILKPKYEEKILSSTLIWKLSLKYIKRKAPWQWLKNSVIFLLQFLTVALLAFMMARPIFARSIEAEDVIIALETSAGMRAETGGATRLSRAVEEIKKITKETVEKSNKVSIILAGEEARLIVDQTQNADTAEWALRNVSASFGGADLDAAAKLAETQLKNNPNSRIVFFTCRNYADPGVAEIRNMSVGDWNAAILGANYGLKNGFLAFTVGIANYNAPNGGGALNIRADIDIIENGAVRSVAMGPFPVALDGGGRTDFEFNTAVSGKPLTAFESAKFSLANADDSFPYDNAFFLIPEKDERFKVQIVSPTAVNYLRSILEMQSGSAVTFIDLSVENHPDPNIAQNYRPPAAEGYDLYVYENYLPEEIPGDGSVWFVNPDAELFAERYARETGVTFLSERVGTIYPGNPAKTAENAFKFAAGADAAAAGYEAVLNFADPTGISATKYRPIDFDKNSGWASIMLCGSAENATDTVFALKNEAGIKTAVLSVDLRFTDMPLNLMWPVFISNLYEYSTVTTLKKHVYDVGETINLRTKPTAVELTVTGAGQPAERRPLTFGNFSVSNEIEYKESVPGLYTAAQIFDRKEPATDMFFVKIPESESDFARTGQRLPPIAAPSDTGAGTIDDNYDIYVYLAAALLALTTLEWGLQYREQF
ncbi:MAG: BatA and WFA domain-containing protein [Clostridiales bacterium]|jgi:hypothetical protein|nr:BatA and WFA domain-containing protein [Clostridiales bacterium]